MEERVPDYDRDESERARRIIRERAAQQLLPLNDERLSDGNPASTEELASRVKIFLEDAMEQSIPSIFEPSATASAIILGDIHNVLRGIPTGVFQTCVTSPPYWSLRDYGLPGQIGLEESVYEYLASLVEAFEEVRRVLRDDGTLWLNIGDSYTSGNRRWRAPDRKNPVRAMNVRPRTPAGLKSKDLIGVPWRLAFMLQEAGWYLRTDIVWNKPNCQPESVRDRPTRSHEYVFLLSKSEKYYYNVDAVKGPRGRRMRTVWDINTHPTDKPAHFATFPPDLVRPCIASSTRHGDIVLDPFLGSGTTALVGLGMGRRFVGCDIQPQYVEMAFQRLERSSWSL